MYNRNDSKNKIAKKKAINKAYNTKKNYIANTLGRFTVHNNKNHKK